MAERFFITKETHIDRPLIVGAILFGIGWGVSGYCPGPAIALLASPNWELWTFLPAAILGAVAKKYFEQRPEAPAAQQPTLTAQEQQPVSASLSSEGSCG